MTLPVDQKQAGQNPRWNWTRHPLLVAVIAALITAVGGYLAGARTGHVLGIVAVPTVTATVTQTASPAPTSGNGGGVGSSAPGQVLTSKTGFHLTDCYALAFTDLSLRPYQITSCTGPSGDLSIDFNGNVQSGAQLAVYSGRADFSQCQADTTYVAPDAFANPNRQPLTGSTLCITTTNRLVTCYVTGDTTSESITAPGLTLDITVYALK